jgi:endonuclease/exonuclease/phosphatase family metal-dependent hydrolase
MNTPLKAIFWNIWGHRHPEQINNFLNQHRDADFICLTEVTHVESIGLPFRDTILCYSDNPNEAPSQVNGYDQLQQHLSDRYSFRYDSATYAPWTCQVRDIQFNNVGFGSMVGVKYGEKIHAEIIAFPEYPKLKPRVLQWVIHERNGVRYLIAHIHGVWIKGNTKGDHPARLIQSKKVREIIKRECLNQRIDKVIFGGDLNLDAKTQSLSLLQCGEQCESDEQFYNLITDFGITNTRTKEYRDYETAGAILYADYVFTSQTVDVHEFTVHNDVLASDHAPLVVRFD